MAEENLKDFTMNWILFGFLFFSLMTFTVSFMYNNNPTGLGDDAESIFETGLTNVSNQLIELEDEGDELLNISAETDPEDGYLGSRDSVATSYGVMGTGKGFWEATKLFIGWTFTGDSGKVMLSVFGGMIIFLGLYFITKWIRNGI